MRKFLLTALFVPAMAFAQTFPSPTFNNLTINGTATFSSQPTFTGGLSLTSLANVAANTVLANVTSATAGVTAISMPSCSTTGSALQYVSGTGFVCVTGLATLASPSFTGTVTIPAGASISGYLTTANAASTYAPLSSPSLVGTPSAPTAASGTSTTQIATTAFVGNAITGMPSATFGTLYLAWFNSLPTTLPASAGVLWNNGGLISKS